MAIEVRKSIPLTVEDQATLDRLRNQDTPEYTALTTLAGPDATRSEAATLHALILLGQQVIQEHALTLGYTHLAASQDDEDHAYHAAMRRRRRPPATA